MSKIDNLAGISQDQREKALDELFSNMPEEVEIPVELPSRSKFYKSSGPVSVKPLLFEDEQRILSSKNTNINIFNEILKKSVDGVDVSDLVLFDKLFLLMKVREASYGADYNFEIACPECGNNTKVSIDIANNLNINYIPDDLEDPRTITLPRLKKQVVVRFPRLREENLLADVDTALKNLHKFVISVDGNDDPVFISKALKRMHIQDLKTITREINKSDYGLDPGILFECPVCDHKENINIPLDANFFLVT